jgi:ankyrin
MKHRVRLHGKKPKSSLKRVRKVARRKLTAEDLVKAMRHRAWPTVKQALEDRVSPEGISIQGDPLIMAAVSIAPVRIVAALLKAGANPSAVNRKRETALFHATDPEVVKRLLQAGADPNAAAKNGATPLHVFAREGRASAMLPLLESGAALEAVDDEGRTPLMLAVENARLEETERLLARGANVAVISRRGEGLLHIAARQRSKAAVAVLERLIAAGADVGQRSGEGLTPLMAARTAEAALLLLDAGANVNAATSTGLTALILAARQADVAVAKVLLAAKADPKARVSAEHPDRHLAGKSAAELAMAAKSDDLRSLFPSR